MKPFSDENFEIETTDIIHDDDPRIRTRSSKVALPLSDEDRILLQDMFRYVKESQDDELAEKKNLLPSVGIAAIQLGIGKNLIAVRTGSEEDGDLMEYALANPRIISKSVRKAALSTGEGCLSVPEGHSGLVPRPASIRVKAYDLLTDSNVIIEAEGYPAIVLQHEIDHLSGTLYYDHIDPQDPQCAGPAWADLERI